MRQRGEFDGEDDVAIGKVEGWMLLERGRGEGGHVETDQIGPKCREDEI